MDIHDLYPMGKEEYIDPKTRVENTIQQLERLLRENDHSAKRTAIKAQLGQVKAKLAAM